jgi:hypothetical protein
MQAFFEVHSTYLLRGSQYRLAVGFTVQAKQQNSQFRLAIGLYYIIYRQACSEVHNADLQ